MPPISAISESALQSSVSAVGVLPIAVSLGQLLVYEYDLPGPLGGRGPRGPGEEGRQLPQLRRVGDRARGAGRTCVVGAEK